MGYIRNLEVGKWLSSEEMYSVTLLEAVFISDNTAN